MKHHVWHGIGSIIKQRILHKKAHPTRGTPQQQSEVIWKCNIWN